MQPGRDRSRSDLHSRLGRRVGIVTQRARVIDAAHNAAVSILFTIFPR